MSADGWMTGDPPCWYSGDHWWNGSVCSQCGARLRCVCGQFMRADTDAHFAECPVLRKVAS